MNDGVEQTRTEEYSQVEQPAGRQVEVVQPRAVAKERFMAGASVAAIVPRTFDEVWRIATLAVKSGLAPRDIKTPERASIAIMHGLEIGLPPMASLQRIAVINGRPCVWGDAVPGIALSTHQLCAWHEEVTGDGDAMVATCTVVRKMGEIRVTKVATFSVADAKKADLWDERPKVKRKDYQSGDFKEVPNDSPWFCYPKRMLQMRARVAFRDLFADAMCGLYIAEELVGRNTDAQMRDVTQYERIENPLGGDEYEEVRGPGNEAAEAAAHAEAVAKKQQPPGARAVAAGASDAGPGESTGQDQNAHGRPKAEGRKAKAAKAPEPAATSPWDAKFPEPYIRQSPESYTAYTLAWIGVAPSPEAARERWTNERKVRSGLAGPLTEEMLDQCQMAMGKVGS